LIALQGTYQDGVSSRAIAARLEVQRQGVRLVTEDRAQDLPLQRLQISDRLGRTVRRVTWGGSDAFVTADHDALEQALACLGHSSGSGWCQRLCATRGRDRDHRPARCAGRF
jgi:hypothetical protein